MFAGQENVEYVYMNQATGEYMVIPESEVSICQRADGTTVVLYPGLQDDVQGLETEQENQPEENLADATDIIYVEDGEEHLNQTEEVEHQEESVVEVQDNAEGLNEIFEDANNETEDTEKPADTRFVMVNEQEVLVVKKAGGASRNTSVEYLSGLGIGYGRNRICPSLQKPMDYENRSTANSEARLMKSRRRTPAQSQKKGPKLIQDFLLPHLDNGTFGNRLVWVDRSSGTFAMSWSHKNGAEWRVDDCIVFREWDRLKKRDVVETHPQYWMESKQRFRAALAKVSTPCQVDSEEFKSSKVFQIKWTRETRPDILDNMGAQPKYFELPPRGSMGRQETLLNHEQVPEGFFVETYTEEEVVATATVENQDIETTQQIEQDFLEAAVSSVSEALHSGLQGEQHQVQYVQPTEYKLYISQQEQYCVTTSERSDSQAASYNAEAKKAAAHVLSSRFFTERGRWRRAKRRPIRQEALGPIEKIVRRYKQVVNRVYTICPLCRFFSGTYSLLLRHLMVHREERAFACLHCTHSFKIPELLLNHLREHHSFGSPNVCFLSNLEAKSSGDLRRAELRLVHQNLRTCAVCAEHCYTEHDLMTHIQELHGIEAVRDVRRAVLKARRRKHVRMRRKFIYSSQGKKQPRNNGNAHIGGRRGLKAKKVKLLRNEEHQTSLVVCDGEVLIEETPVGWGAQVL
ncbi:uncharacterized protein LOC111259263 isoform X2 [Varroa jacobsoni]|uniref:uncharacterized protein LOC111259263 isoform X2 n=1 Tax=Varroa jacobsoni TaxID=62625 RepID=UPI000BF473FE|nr:uncharacterized protein LOC111259263 isoform X2 [Varroa jacobsoni]